MTGHEAGSGGRRVLGRTFWIQGRSGPYWQNLESHEDGQSAIGRLGILVGDDRYDELRLIQADLSPITGKTSYVHIVTVKDGQVLEPASAERSPATAPHAVAAAPEPTPEQQMHFWPEPHPEEIQPRLNLYAPGASDDDSSHPAAYSGGEMPRHHEQYEHGYEDAHPARRMEEVPRSTPFQANPGEQSIGGWRIPEHQGAGPNATDPRLQPNAQQSAHTRDRAQGRNGLASDPNERRDGRGRISSSPQQAARIKRRARDGGPLDRNGIFKRGLAKLRPGSDRNAPPPEKDGRAALLSGVFAGAMAAGLALASLSPETAARFYGGLVGDLSQLLPRSNLVEAIEAGDLPSVRARLLEGADPNTIDSEGTPVLLRAARAGNLAALTMLIQAGADPTRPLPEGRTVLHHLAAEGRSQALSRLLAAGAPADVAGGAYGCLTPLAVASANGRVRAAGLLAEHGASLDPQESCKVGPLEIAAGHPHVLARLEQIRAQRESLLRIAAGPAPSAVPEAEILVSATDDLSDVTAGAIESPSSITPYAPPEPRSVQQVDVREQTATPNIAEHQEATPQPVQTIRVESLSVQAAPAAPQPAARASTAPKSVATATASNTIEPRTQKGVEVLAALTGPDGTPRARTKPSPPSLTPKQFAKRLRAAIDDADTATVRLLLTERPAGVNLNRLRVVVHDRFGSGERSILDHAALSNRRDIAGMLSAQGAKLSPSALHTAIKYSGTPGLGGLTSDLLALGADVNAVQDGLTPLMRAALNGDEATAALLLQNGANAAIVAADGRTASDMAGAAGKTALQERLLLTAREADYTALMLGMSWKDTLETLRHRAETCKSIGDDFTACKMSSPAWIDDAAVVVTQFDGRNGNRLVAIQIDSQPLTTPGIAKGRFAEVVREIEQRLPTDHVGFSTANAPEGAGFFRALRPEINAGSYFAYWPDQEKSRPVFVHLKLSGINDRAGFYRIIIGNPFRTG